ncbi:MAG TPA: CBS domain-containing protein [Acidimicrobiales bacterium]|nr:CBS domain-containing protein [Acidimicrobiales bacterium]
MRIDALLSRKGNAVVTVAPDRSVADVLAELADHNIGALVVSSDGVRVEGIVSERDVVRHLHATGPGVLSDPVSSIMSTEVHTCAPNAEVESLVSLMTTRRVRHVPVVQDGSLIGIVSIGDVVKSRMDELEADRKALVDYIYAR